MVPSRPEQLLRDNLTIPTLPDVVLRVQRLVDDPAAGMREIGAVVAEDAPLAAKVLRIANSAFYGLREPCLSTEQASAVLGSRVLRNVVTQAAVMNRFQHLEAYADFDLQDLWRQSIVTGHVCSKIARRCRTPLELSPDEFYVCGLLHDIGRIVMLDNMGESYLDAVRESRDADQPLQITEQRLLGFDHTDVGALVAQRWSLPEPVAAAIQYHHGPREVVERDPVVCLVARANELVHRVCHGRTAAAEHVFDAEAGNLIGIWGRDAEGLVAMAEAALSTVAF